MLNFFKTLTAVLTAIVTFFCAGGISQLAAKGDITGFAEYAPQKELCDLYTDENGDFTVLQFSDTHFTTGLSWNDITVMRKMERQIQENDPDLVVITGDLVDDGENGAFNKQYVLDKVSELFEKLDCFWAYVPGNNDGMNYGSSADVTAYLSQYEHCLALDVKEISGGAQYSIDIRNDKNELVHSLVFLDTMDYDDEDSQHIYGFVHEDQVKWCENEIAKKQAENKNVNVSVFIHENTPNFAVAAENGETYAQGYSRLDSMPEIYNIPKNQPLDDVFEKSGCVGLVSMGHSHPKDCKCCYYNGTYYHVTPKTIKMSTLITIHTDAAQTRQMYDFSRIVTK